MALCLNSRAIDHLPQVNIARTPTRFRGWQQVAEQLILFVGQITRIRFTHVALLALCFYGFTAYNRRAFLRPFDLFKRPLNPDWTLGYTDVQTFGDIRLRDRA
jgi:hypothetical protein